MAQIIQICKILFFAFFLCFHLTTPLKAENSFGSFLSWNFAKNTKDIDSLENYLSKIKIDSLNFQNLEELFFESVLLNDWQKARKVSQSILSQDEYNLIANLFEFVASITSGKTNSLDFVKKINVEEFDLNFVKVLLLWTKDKAQKKENIIEDCIPLLCLHLGLTSSLEGKSDISKFYYSKIKQNEFGSFRVKELIIIDHIKNQEFELADIIISDLINSSLNLQKYNSDYLKENLSILDPVENSSHGLAETFYNISSWYYTKGMYKYAAFFGELSLRLRPNFKAMNLLLVGAYEKLGYLELSLNRIGDFKVENIYLFKFLRLKLLIFDKLGLNKNSIEHLEEYLVKFPNNKEIQVLLADRLRQAKRFTESINLYNLLLENDSIKDKWSLLYSRGIAYEQSGKWSKAEKDLIYALNLNPKNPYILNYLGYSWLDRNKNIKEALNLLETAVDIEPSDAYIVDSLGWAYYLSGFFDKSIYYLEKAVALLPNDATLNDHLGDVYWMVGRKLEAISQWKRVLIFDPNFKRKNQVRKKINSGL